MPKKKTIIILIVLAVVIALFFSSNGRISMGEIRIENSKKGNICEYIKLRGKVELDNKAQLYAQIPGILTVLSREGERVKKTNLIAEIDTSELEIILKKSAALYEAAEANLMEQRTSVKIEQIKQAEQQLEQAAIALNSSEKDYNYKKDLYNKTSELRKKGSISAQGEKDVKIQYDTAENAYLEAEKRVKIAQYNLQLLKKGASEYILTAAERAVEQAKMQVEQIRNDIAKASIFPVIDGVVLSKYFESGSYVQTGAHLFDIGDYSSAYIRVEALTDDISKIMIGRKALISGDILNGAQISAEVSFIAPKAFTKVSSLGVEQQKIEVRLKYDTSKYEFRPGYEFDVNILAAEKNDAIFVPYKAVFEQDGHDSLFVLRDNAIQLREVATGIENDDYIEIKTGLLEGEKIIIDPPNKVKPGMKVKI